MENIKEEWQLKEKFVEETGEKYPSNENYKYTEWLTKLILSGVSVSFEEGYKKGWREATKEACQEIAKNYQPNER